MREPHRLSHERVHMVACDPAHPVDQLHVYAHAQCVGETVQLPQPLLPVRDSKALERVIDRRLCNNVLPVVLDKELPLCRIMVWQVASASSIGLGWLAGLAKVTDKGFALPVLLHALRQPQSASSGGQSGRIAEVQRAEHRATPLLYRRLIACPVEAVPFESRVVCVLDDVWIG